MQSDAERFRPRESDLVGGDAAPPDGSADLTHREPPTQQRYAPTQQRYAPPQYGAGQQYNDPQTGSAGVWSAPTAGMRIAQGYGSRPLRAGTPPLEGRDAPLIHPAAAQASTALPYGVPVYRAPVYAVAAPPQRGLSITALVLGICSSTFAWTLVVVPILGIVFGFIALKREPAGRAMAIAGLIGSAIGLLWVALFYLLPLAGLLMAVVVAAGSA